MSKQKHCVPCWNVCSHDRAAGGSAVVDEKRIRTASPGQEIRASAAIQDVDAAANGNRVIAATGRDEPVGRGGGDVQIVRVIIRKIGGRAAQFLRLLEPGSLVL